MFAFAVSVRAQPFTKVSDNIPRTFPGETVWADFDGDGDMDILYFDLVETSTEEPRLYRNDGVPTFTRVDLPPVSHTYPASRAFWADDNGDGLLDLLLTSSDVSGNPTVRLLYQQPNHSFVDAHLNLTGAPLLWADLDNDGKLDIVTSIQGWTNSSRIYWKTSANNYAVQTVVPDDYIEEIAAADLDGDGDLDLLIGTGPIARTTVQRNDSSRRFVTTGNHFPAMKDLHKNIVDLNGDGRLDILAMTEGTDSDVPRVFLNEGNFGFSDSSLSGVPIVNGILRWADFNQDGYPDVLA